MTSFRSFFLALISVISLTTGCGQKAVPQNSETNAVVTNEQFQASEGIIAAIDYLPFKYLDDGCFARALYMSMELAVREIPSSSIYAYEKNSSHPLRLQNGIEWNYHVAPMIKNGIQGEETIIDPAMGPNRMPLNTWLHNMSYAGDDHPPISRTQGSNYFEPSEGDMQPLLTSFHDMSAFNAENIEDACDTLYSYLHLDPLRAPDETQWRNKLIQRTTTMLADLARLNKLETGGSTSITCGDARISLP